MKRIQFICLVLPVLLIMPLSCEKSDSGAINEVLHVRHKGADMPAYVHGNPNSKTILIVLHGAGSYGLAFRDGTFTSVLEEEMRVVYWDQRGQGMSEGRYKSPDDLIALMAEDVLALLEVLKFKYGADNDFYLLGHSWGGMLGTSVLLTGDSQHLFKGFISVDGAHDFPLASTSRKDLLQSVADEQLALGKTGLGWEELGAAASLLDSLSEEYYHNSLLLAQECIKLLHSTGVIQSSVSGEKLFRAIVDNNPLSWQVSNFFNQPVQSALDRNYSLSDSLDRISIPTLLMYGKYDVSVPPALGYDAYARIGSEDKKLVIFEHSIHHPHDTEPEKFAEEVLLFVRDIVP